MADLAFAPQHNMVAYLEKTEDNAEFHQIVDFFTSSSIHHALTIYATIDGKKVVITESSVRRDLLFTDDNGITLWMLRLSIRRGDSLVRAATTASLDAQRDSSNIAKTQSKETLIETNHQGEGSSSGPGRQETMGGAMAQIIFEGVPIQSSDPPLSIGNTVESEEDRMEHAIKLTDHVPQTPHDSPLSGGHTPRSGEGSMTLMELTDLCTTLSQKGRKNLKSQQKFLDIDDLVYEEVIVEDKGSGEKRGSTAKTVSTARLDISAARREVSTVEPKTPLTTTTLFDDEDVTIADTLTKKRDQDQIERDAEVSLKIQADLDEEVRTEREKQKEDSKATLAKLYDEKIKRELEVEIKEQQVVNDQKSVDSDKELKKCLKVVPDDDKAINYETLDVKSLIVDCESRVLGTMVAGDVHVYKRTRLDGSYRHFSTFSKMLKVLDRQDVLDLHKIVMESFPTNDPEGYDLILWGDMKTLMESSEDDEIWGNQQDWKLLS
uniref:Uncharacterized protein n=1 Tax=Tanacetum cinerariifolium TaxID=118510 RepID=A0A6L2JQI8_TANCI|nr:hypothetical protein [Tanacetum cinerariifolium]